MRLSLVILFMLAAAMAASAQQINSVEPGNGKAGDVVTVAGDNLHKDNVAKIYLTDGKNDVVMEITDQAATSIKFKIPAKIQAGRFSLMLLTSGKDPKLLVQPVKFTVDQ
jgi:hypothetical protein